MKSIQPVAKTSRTLSQKTANAPRYAIRSKRRGESDPNN
jgi:hypothetical protein